jgi:hypothetical protein
LKLVDGKECQKNEMICKLCRPGLGDEFHYICLCNCDEVKLLRQKYIPRSQPHLTANRSDTYIHFYNTWNRNETNKNIQIILTQHT